MPRVSRQHVAAALIAEWRLSTNDALPQAVEELALSLAHDEAARLGTPIRATQLDHVITEQPLTAIASLLSLRPRGSLEPASSDLHFLPPHVNHSGVGYRVESAARGELRRPLDFGIRIAGATLRRIVQAQPFANVEDLLARTPLDSVTARRLAQGGALGGLPGDLLPDAPRTRGTTAAPPTPLFTEGEGVMSARYRGPQLVERVLARLASTTDSAIHRKADPLHEHRAMLAEFETHPLSELAGLREGYSVRIAGVRISGGRTGHGASPSAGDGPLVSVLVEDGSGECEVILCDELAQAYSAQLAGTRALLFDGTLRMSDGAVTLAASGAWSLADMASRWRATTRRGAQHAPEVGRMNA